MRFGIFLFAGTVLLIAFLLRFFVELAFEQMGISELIPSQYLSPYALKAFSILFAFTIVSLFCVIRSRRLIDSASESLDESRIRKPIRQDVVYADRKEKAGVNPPGVQVYEKVWS